MRLALTVSEVLSYNYQDFSQKGLITRLKSLIMQMMKPSKLGIFQILIACLLVALFTCPGEAHHGPMLIIKGGHGGGGSGAASLLAAGILIQLLTEMKHHHKGFSGGISGGFSGGHGYGGGHAGGGYSMPGNGVGHSFASHDAHLQDYGYEPQGHAWAK